MAPWSFCIKFFSRELILSQFTQGHIHQDVYSLIFISISNFPQSQGFGVDLYCRPPGQVPVVLNSLISNVSEIYTMISRLMCRSWINVTQGRAVSEAEKGSCLKAIARESPSRLQPCSALLASGKLPRRKIFEERKKVAAFVDWELARADTGNQCKELDNIDTEDNTHRQLN